MGELRLDGCTPEPLMSYLKALGVLRMVAEQTDGSVCRLLAWTGHLCCNRISIERD